MQLMIMIFQTLGFIEMSYRYMRVIVFFDLASVTLDDKREYRKFRKHLLKTGFVMMQESVYSKIALNTTAANAIIENLNKNKPDFGNIQVMIITEKQYGRIIYLLGDHESEIIDNDERYIEL